MIAFDIAYELSFGAWMAAGKRPHSKRRALIAGLAASCLVYIPSCAIGLWLWPSWQSMYLADLDQHPAALATAVIVQTAALLGAFVIGFFGTRSLGIGRRRLRNALAPVWLLIIVVLFGVLWRRAFLVVTVAAFRTQNDLAIRWGAPEAMLGGPVMWFLIASGAINLVAFVAAQRWREHPRVGI
jgi:hypothetical protein